MPSGSDHALNMTRWQVEQMPSGSDHALNMTRWQVVKTVVKCIFPKSLSHRQGMGNVKFL